MLYRSNVDSVKCAEILAHIYLILKNRESALDVLENVLKIDPGNDTARQEWIKAGAVPDKNK